MAKDKGKLRVRDRVWHRGRRCRIEQFERGDRALIRDEKTGETKWVGTWDLQ